MVDLLMLGIVPGTNIQIDFADWVICILAVAVCMMLIFILKRHVIAMLSVAFAMYGARRHSSTLPSPHVAS